MVGFEKTAWNKVSLSPGHVRGHSNRQQYEDPQLSTVLTEEEGVEDLSTAIIYGIPQSWQSRLIFLQSSN